MDLWLIRNRDLSSAPPQGKDLFVVSIPEDLTALSMKLTVLCPETLGIGSSFNDALSNSDYVTSSDC
jgi:hypothetical protein